MVCQMQARVLLQASKRVELSKFHKSRDGRTKEPAFVRKNAALSLPLKCNDVVPGSHLLDIGKVR